MAKTRTPWLQPARLRDKAWLDWLERHPKARRFLPRGYLATLRHRARPPRPGGKPAPATQLTGFAWEAYPHLSDQARRFRRFYKRLPMWTAVWLVLTGLVAWDVATSSGVLQKITPPTGNLPSATVNDESCNLKVDGGMVADSPKPPTDKPADCEALRKQEQTTYLAQSAGAALFAGGQTSGWHPVGFVVRHFGPPGPPVNPARPPVNPAGPAVNPAGPPVNPAGPAVNPAGPPVNPAGPPVNPAGPAVNPAGPAVNPAGPAVKAAQGDKAYAEAAAIDFAATVVNVFSNNILPMMFGLLGTLAGVMRSIYAKVRDNTLSPRDYRLSWSLLPLGAVAGLTVGLIIPPNAGSPGVTAGVVLSAASLSFLAGYGSEFFFGMLDAALTRIFSTNPSGTPK